MVNRPFGDSRGFGTLVPNLERLGYFCGSLRDRRLFIRVSPHVQPAIHIEHMAGNVSGER